MSKVQKALAKGSLKGAKIHMTKDIESANYEQWQKDRKAEYDIIYPAYRDMTNDEMLLYDSDNFTEENPKPLEFEYPKVAIDYSEDENYLTYNEWVQNIEYIPLEITDEMIMAELVKVSGVTTVSMRQCRLALLNAGLLSTVQNAIDSGTDEALKIEWEYALDVKRDWSSLISLATSLGLTSDDLDNLFFQASLL